MPNNIAIPIFYQHKDDVLKYTWDFTRILAGVDTIDMATVTPDTGFSAVNAAISTDTYKVTALLSGGALYSIYNVICKIVTDGGQTINRTLAVQIVPR
jgi:hypothetical protein